MTTIEIPFLVSSALAGVLLGFIFFGGLWWTVRRGVSAKQPALWFVVSLLLRLTIVLAGLYLVARSHWPRLLFCLLGFVIARLLVLRLTRTFEARSAPEVTLAP
jgi:F1F0 ATPase subunit 2